MDMASIAGSEEALASEQPAPWYSPSNSRGNLKFVSLVARCPCLVVLLVWLMCFTWTGLLIRSIQGKALDEIITTPRSEYDLHDIRSIKQDSLQVALSQVRDQRTAKGVSVAQDVVVAKPMSQRLDSLFFVYEPAVTLFDTTSAAAIKNIEEIVTRSKDFPTWCMRKYVNNTDMSDDHVCAAMDLSPLKFLYASQFDARLTRSIIDRLKNDKKLADYKMMSPCFEFPAPKPFLLNGSPVPPQEVPAVWEKTCDPACFDSKTPAMEACSLSTQDKEDARKLSNDINSIVHKWDGMAGAPVSDMETLAEFVAWMKELPTRAGLVDFNLDKNFNKSHTICKWSRSLIYFGGPLPDLNDDGSRKFKDVNDDRSTQSERMLTWLREVLPEIKEAAKGSHSAAVDMTYFSDGVIFDQILDLLVVDSSLAIISIGLVFTYIWFNTGSFFLAAVGMSEIVLSLPVAWSVMRNLIRVEAFGATNAMSIFIVCAIGADDIFVFMDAYTQSQFKGPAVNRDLETRMSWVFRKSGSAMLITSATTCAAFLCCLATPIVGTQSFGLFAALIIAIDYLLVMTLFCSAVMVYHNHFEKKPLCGCSLPSPCGSLKLGCCTEGCDFSSTKPSPTEQAFNMKQDRNDSTNSDPTELFFRTKFSGFILNQRNRILLGLMLVAWLIPAAIFTSRLQPTTDQEQFLRDDHPLQKSLSVMNTQFGSSAEEDGTLIYYTWGLKDIDRNGADMLFNLTYLGEPTYDTAFQFTPQCMDKVRRVCDDLKDQASRYYLDRVKRSATGRGSVQCFVYDLEAVASEKSWKLNSKDDINNHMDEFMKTNAKPGVGPGSTKGVTTTMENKYANMLGWNGSTIKFIGIALEATNLTSNSRPSEGFARENYESYLDLSSKINEVAAKECGEVQMTDLDGKFVFMNNQAIYRKSAVSGSIMGIGVAAIVIFLSTWSLLTSTIATMSICCVMISVVGLTTMMGWTLGTIQSILITILAGFSVDYVVHLAHAYCKSAGTREERIVSAFSEMGSPVLSLTYLFLGSGMITSVVASLPLFGCSLVFFNQFGTFMCFTIAFSWVFANLGFMSIMATLGPENLASSAKADDTSSMMVTVTVSAEHGAGCVPGKEGTMPEYGR